MRFIGAFLATLLAMLALAVLCAFLIAAVV